MLQDMLKVYQELGAYTK